METRILTVCLKDTRNQDLEKRLLLEHMQLVTLKDLRKGFRAVISEDYGLVIFDFSDITDRRAERTIWDLRKSILIPVIAIANLSISGKLLAYGADVCLTAEVGNIHLFQQVIALLRGQLYDYRGRYYKSQKLTINEQN